MYFIFIKDTNFEYDNPNYWAYECFLFCIYNVLVINYLCNTIMFF